MNVVTCLSEKVPEEVLDYQVLMDYLSNYRKPRDAVTRLLSSGRRISDYDDYLTDDVRIIFPVIGNVIILSTSVLFKKGRQK